MLKGSTREPRERFYGGLPERKGQNLAVTAIYVARSLDSGASEALVLFFVFFITLKPRVE